MLQERGFVEMKVREPLSILHDQIFFRASAFLLPELIRISLA